MAGKPDIEERVLKSSVDLFYKQGFVGASIRDIVRASGVTSSTVYIYFKSKQEILYKIIVDAGRDLLEELKQVTEEQEEPVDCLKAMIFRQICFSMDNYKKMKIYLEEQYQLRPHLKKKALKQHREIYDLYYATISEIEKRGLLYEGDKTLMTFSIFAVMNWMYRWFNPGGKLTVEKVAENTVDLIGRAILRNS